MAPTIEEMKSQKLFTSVSVLEKMLSSTEPVDTIKIEADVPVSFHVADDWLIEAPKSELAPVNVQAMIDGKEYALSKAAAFAVGQKFGIQSTYAKKISGEIYQTLLNYHYESMGSKAFAGLVIGDTLHGLVRPGLTVYSNTDMLQRTIDGIWAAYGTGTEILVDRRTFNTLTRTDLRLVVPEIWRAIEDGGLHDVPSGEEDRWAAGVHVVNSVTGQTPTSINAYLFRYWCANGATVRNEEVGNWHRQFDSTVDLYDWSETTTAAILDGMEKQFDAVQALTNVDVDGKVGDTINTALRPLKISASMRNQIAESLLDYDDVSLYTVMNAITSYQHEPGLDQDYINRFMTAGGNLAAKPVASEKALLWNEGHLAPKEASNPYLIGA